MEELFTVRVKLGDADAYDAPTHLFGDVNLIPYGDTDDVKDAAGNVHRGDEAVAHYFPPGEIGFAIKHHRASNRLLQENRAAGAEGSKDAIKLQDTHIEIVVGVVRKGRPGVITINNPQNYQNGGFGDADAPGDYPMIFVKPVFPDYLPAEARALLIDNIRTMAVCFNTVSTFPKDYDGGDPLSARTPEKIREQVRMMVKAVAGDREAKAYFERDENQMYCAELAFIATSAGLLVPLNTESVLKLGVTGREWARFKNEVKRHNLRDRDTPSFFVKNNRNKKIALVHLANLEKLADLKPLPFYSGAPEPLLQKLAFQPLTMADIMDGFMRLHFPRQQMGEHFAPDEARVLAQMKPDLLKMLSLDPSSPEYGVASGLFDQIVTVVGTKHESYATFRAAVEPHLQSARTMTTSGSDGVGFFTPPCLFHLVLKGMNTDGGLIGLAYVGHGLHFSMLKPR